jgi:hypothetical protein
MNAKHIKLGGGIVMIVVLIGSAMRTSFKLPARHVTSRGIDLFARRIREDIKASWRSDDLDAGFDRLAKNCNGELDGWNRPYRLRLSWDKRILEITSSGQDGNWGTSDDFIRTVDLPTSGPTGKPQDREGSE